MEGKTRRSSVRISSLTLNKSENIFLHITSKAKTESHIEYMRLVTVVKVLKEPTGNAHISI